MAPTMACHGGKNQLLRNLAALNSVSSWILQVGGKRLMRRTERVTLSAMNHLWGIVFLASVITIIN